MAYMRWITTIIVVLLAGCAAFSGYMSLADLASSNQSKLAQLSVGMNKDDVISHMGMDAAKTKDGIVNNPWTVETFIGNDGFQYQVLYYVTRKNPRFTPVTKSLTTPLVLKSDQLIGWGADALYRISGK